MDPAYEKGGVYSKNSPMIPRDNSMLTRNTDTNYRDTVVSVERNSNKASIFGTIISGRDSEV